MSNKKIISCFQYPVKTTVFTISRKSFHTGCSNLTSMVLYVVIFQQMTYFFAVKTSPNMIRLTVKNIIIKKQLNFFFQSSWCSILYYFRCGFCTIVSMRIDSMRIGWFTNVPPLVSLLVDSHAWIEIYK
jgi:hypothetical protein